jgi:hypothetical protein
MWYPLRREGLQLLDRVVSCLIEEGPDEVEALVVGDVRSRFLMSWLAVRVLHSNISTTL